jgi:hypothetical protein
MSRCAVAILACSAASLLQAATLRLRVLDDAGQPLPCRVHLKDGSGTPQRAPDLPFWKDHFVCSGTVDLDLKPGKYAYEIERGPEYRRAAGSVELADGNDQELKVSLARLADMAARGWWSGELHVHRAIEEMPLHLRAEDLHVAPVITWWNGRNLWRDRQPPEETLAKVDADHVYDVMAGEDEREGGALLYFGLKRPLPLPGDMRTFPEHPSPMEFFAMARQHPGTWIDIEKPFWWDAPVWLASGVDSIGIANNHMCRDTMYPSEAWGKPRDAERLPPPRGNGFWSQEIYYHVLDCGLRVPPSAGSASGVLPNPVGYNRVYVQLDGEFSYDAWWQGLKAGRSFVTNGPLLVCTANGKLPGNIFQSDGQLDIELDVELIASDSVPAVEVIVNGRTFATIALEDSAHRRASTKLTLNESGWFLVRAIADNANTFRFASTAPFYVEVAPAKTRISRRSAQFFLDWLEEREQRVPQKLADPAKLAEVLQHHHAARRFWQERLSKANAE